MSVQTAIIFITVGYKTEESCEINKSNHRQAGKYSMPRELVRAVIFVHEVWSTDRRWGLVVITNSTHKCDD